MVRNKIAIIAFGLSLLGASACRKQFDINQNPNVAQDVQPALLLSTAELEIGSALGVDMNNNGSIWVQHWTQSASASQYKTLEQYQPNASTYDRVWTLLYSGALTDLKQLNQRSGTAATTQYRAISMLLTAYTFQLITDAWGDVPYSQALNGLPGDGSNLSPKFDAQEQIYNGIIQMTKDGLALIDLGDTHTPGSDDLIYGGDMSLWEKFGNTLLLRMYMRLSERSPAVAQAGAASVFSNGIGFIDRDEDAQINYSTTGGNQNPLSSEVRRLGQNQVASATSADSLNSNADPRRTKFYNTSGTVVGLRQGQTVAQTGVTYTVPNPLTGANSAALASSPTNYATASSAPVKLLTSYESLLLQSEVVARNWAMSSTTADTLFREGVQANFLAYGLTITQANTYLANANWGKYPTTGSMQQMIRHIITQKWFCMNGNQGFEAWTEWRRTGYPNFLVISASSLIGNNFPARFFYPDVEFSRNANFPGQKQITDKVWWDVN